MTDAHIVLLLAGAADPVGVSIAQSVLLAGGRVAAAVPRAWQVEKVREQLLQDGVDAGALLIGLVAPRDAEAAAGLVKGATDALGAITHLAGASMLLRQRQEQREPAGDLDELLDANLHSNATLARAALPAMRQRRSGRLVFVTQPSNTADLSTTCRASLAAMGAFANALATNVRSVGLEVETVAAPIDEPLAQNWLAALVANAGAS